MRVTSTILIVAVGFALSGCATARPDHHVLKLDKTYDPVISNPYEWALQQFSDGPVSGPNISDYARLVLTNGLKRALADLGGDGTQELLLRQDCPARVWEVLVFRPVIGGYRYLGHFPASAIVPDSTQASLLVYEACGGKYGHIKIYRHDGQRFIGTVVESLWSGDGYDEGSQKLARLFPQDEVINWAKTPNNDLQLTK
jgi:hypothetical protein